MLTFFHAQLVMLGLKIQCEEDAVKALIQLHNLGPQVCVIFTALQRHLCASHVSNDLLARIVLLII